MKLQKSIALMLFLGLFLTLIQAQEINPIIGGDATSTASGSLWSFFVMHIE